MERNEQDGHVGIIQEARQLLLAFLVSQRTIIYVLVDILTNFEVHISHSGSQLV